jgi:hypothetical protein
MEETSRSIFRAGAVQRHAERRDKTVLPRLVSPHTFLALWLALGMFLAAGVLAWYVRVPVYVTGPGVAMARQGQPIDGEVVAMVFLPAELRPALHPGQMMFLDLNGTGVRMPRSIVAVEPDILSPSAARSRFALAPTVANAISGPVVAVILDPVLPPGLPAETYVGSVYRAEVQVDSRRLLSLVPLIGQMLGG